MTLTLVCLSAPLVALPWAAGAPVLLGALLILGAALMGPVFAGPGYGAIGLVAGAIALAAALTSRGLRAAVDRGLDPGRPGA